MDSKYAGKTVVLNKHTTEIVQRVQAALEKTFGFKPSLSDVVSYLATDWQNRQTSEGDKPNE
jgi:hypothetical protein